MDDLKKKDKWLTKLISLAKLKSFLNSYELIKIIQYIKIKIV